MISDRLQNLEIVRRRRIASLKADLIRHYQKYQRLRGEVDCGIEMHKTISPDFAEACNRLNSTIAELRKIDPTAPYAVF